MQNDLLLEVHNLTKTYPTGAGSLTVLRDVSFELRAGDSCAIVGPSGSGKTTLLGLCAGLDVATSGSVKLVGTDLASLDEPQGDAGTHGYRTGGWTAAPVVAQIIDRIGPILGVPRSLVIDQSPSAQPRPRPASKR